MKRTISLFLISTLVAACLVAGCTSSPPPKTVQTLTPTPEPTAPIPTLIGNSDEAHITFTYQVGKQSEVAGLQKAAPGKALYVLQVKVSSDKPVETSADWFWMDYKANESDSVHSAPYSFSYVKYPTKTLNSSTDSVGGELVFELPENMATGYPQPYYYMPMNEQRGPYKVYGKVYGTLGDVQGTPLK